MALYPGNPAMISPPEQLRARLIDALKADLIGPYDLHNPQAREVLPTPPSRWYLTGFLACQGQDKNEDPHAHDTLGEETMEEREAPEIVQRAARRFPASVGLSVLLAPGTQALTAVVRFGTYRRARSGEPGFLTTTGARAQWHRTAHSLEVQVSLARPAIHQALGEGISLRGEIRPVIGVPGIAQGAHALSLFLVNQQPVLDGRHREEAYLFQVELHLKPDRPFLPRPAPFATDDTDERVADLQFRDVLSYAVGHGAATEEAADGAWARTCFLPQGRVTASKTRALAEVEVDIKALADLAAQPNGEALRAALSPLLIAYQTWLDTQAARDVGAGGRAATQEEIDARARVALRRLSAGLDRLAQDKEARQAFAWMNEAMAAAAHARSPQRYRGDARPRWRLFQLAFILLSVVSVCEDQHDERDLVDLIFFPTGGGKTEAYLGVIAFTLLLRRLRGAARPDGGLGVAVLLRYTLRLLTLDQLGRAATLICALEQVRRQHPKALGTTRFSVGLWVGKSATANTLSEVNAALEDNKAGRTSDSPCPLAACPWCQAPLDASALRLIHDKPKGKGKRKGDPMGVEVRCRDLDCDFSQAPGLPLLFVDEQIYRELPSFLLSTVDKLAMLPWRGQSAALFGRVHSLKREDEVARFFGVIDHAKPAGEATALPQGLTPPELIVQDEVHLISGPLGTMVGLYETTVERLCHQTLPNGDRRRPKIIASTATTRQAEAQIRALFARDVALFPPPGIDDGESFFAQRDAESPDRRYIGVCALGHPLKTALLRLYITAMGAAEALWREVGPAADAWMTALGYFNSLRELGGTRRLIEDIVRSRLQTLEARRPLDHAGPHRWFAHRQISPMPVELTSREYTHKIAQAKDRLALTHENPQRVDVALATNMISVGVDIDRLGLMIVAGQPKAMAEYIQATSRVGRQAKTHPGLVLVCLNAQRPRDRSHFEHFHATHQALYRHVEVNSLTPFSGPALDRGLVGALVALVRLADPAFTPTEGVMRLAQQREDAAWVSDVFARRAIAATALDAEGERRLQANITARVDQILDAWRRLAVDAAARNLKRHYSPFERGGKDALLKTYDENNEAWRFLNDDEISRERLFIAPTSMRDVEPVADIWVKQPSQAQNKTKTTKAEGEVRRSQLLTGYGPGALVDLIDYAVLIQELDAWRIGNQPEIIDEPRLSALLGRPTLKLYAPPARQGDPHPDRGITARIFPRWFVCQGCRALVDLRALTLKKRRFYHECAEHASTKAKKPSLAVPVRFVLACAHGHLDEIDWVGLAHMGHNRCVAPRLRLVEGETGDFNEVTAKCETCGKSGRISHLLDQDKRPRCRGRRPWLRGDIEDTTEPCEEKARMVLRTASNTYFSQTRSVISIPDFSDPLYDGVRKEWKILQAATPARLPAFRSLSDIQVAVGDASDATILEMVARIQAELKGEAPTDQARANPFEAEYAQLTRAPIEAPGERPTQGVDFFARRLADAPPKGIAQIVLVHILREVQAQLAFTRLDFPQTTLQGEHDLDIKAAPLSQQEEWRPAIEIRGEGLFIQLDEAALRAWEARPEVRARAEQLRLAFERGQAKQSKPIDFYGARYYLLHSLSHLLINALSLTCGYAASAIHERIYCSDAQSGAPMAGILLSTGTPGSEGTLGGLVEQGRHLTAHLKRALELGQLCSNDPICAAHNPNQGEGREDEGREYEGAACHSCLFIAESSCERFNRALDRALVVRTLDHAPGLAFFEAP
ncbi:DISARM system helicase DrmA [Myxococcota bacterium]|nr:DISARM system helicase DrmA [Myxococcota bacterium]